MSYVGTAQNSGNDLLTLASVIQGEAGGEGDKGMRAVASVIANRAAQNFSDYGNDPVSQATAKSQFQGQAKPSSKALLIAADLLAGNLKDVTGGATYYANPEASTAEWAKRLNSDNAVKIGNHYFTDNASGKPFVGMASQDESSYDKAKKQVAADIPKDQLSNLIAAYQSGAMPQEAKTAFETDVKAGKIMLPEGMAVGGASPNAKGGAVELPQSVIDAYNKGAANPYDPGAMPEDSRKLLDQHLKEGKVTLPSGAVLNPHYMGIGEKIKEAVTGDLRSTDETRNNPDVATMPEMNEVTSIKGWKVGLGTMTGSPAEIAQVIKTNYPGVQVSQDAKGNYLIQSSIDGKMYAIRPGMTLDDVVKGIGVGASFNPVARGVVGLGIQGAATEAAWQGARVGAGGGDFHPGEIATAGALNAGLPVLARAVEAATPMVKAAAAKTLGNAAPDAAQAAPEAVSAATPVMVAEAPKPPMAAPTAPAAEAAPEAAILPKPEAAPPVPAPTLTGDELTQVTKKAAEGGIGAKAAKEAVAVNAAPDKETIEAAKRLGIEGYLQPDHVTTNQAFRELSQAVKSIPGSQGRAAELEGLTGIANRADKLIDDLGGTKDVSSLSSEVKDNLQAMYDGLKAKASKLYGELRESMPTKTPVSADSTLAFIKQRADDLGGAKNLTPTEKMILDKLSPQVSKSNLVDELASKIKNAVKPSREDVKQYLEAKASGNTNQTKQPTYALLDDVRRDLTSAKYKQTGPFKDADQYLLEQLEKHLMQDQKRILTDAGLGDKFALAQSTARTYKGIQNDLTSLFGKQVNDTMSAKLSTAMRALPTGNETKLIQLLKSVPKDLRKKVVASGLATAFNKSALNGRISFSDYAKWYEGLKQNKRAFDAIMSNLPLEARGQLADLYKVAKGISLASRERITTGRIQAIQNEFQRADGLTEAIYKIAGKVSKGAAAEAVSSTMGLPGAGMAAALHSALTEGKTPAIKAADALLASPEFAESVKLAANGNTSQASSRLAYSKPFIRFVRSVGNPRELTNKERFIMQALEVKNNQEN